MMLEQDMTDAEAQQLSKTLRDKTYAGRITYISKEEALKEATKALGSDPSEFVGGNPYTPIMEMHLNARYANNDSLAWIAKDLKRYPKIQEVSYQQDLVDKVNRMITNIGLVLLVLAVLLTFISFSLINNTVRLGIYARRFSIHTMKLVGASWGFIRRPFIKRALVIGFIAAFFANLILLGIVYFVYVSEPEILQVITYLDMIIVVLSVFLFGIVITSICSTISVNRFLKMKAGELYKI